MDRRRAREDPRPRARCNPAPPRPGRARRRWYDPAVRFAAPLLALFLSLGCLYFLLRHPPRGDARLAEPDAASLARAQRRWDDASLDQLRLGHRLMRTACAECHGIPDPASRPMQDWPRLVAHMGGRAELTPAQREAVLRYIVSSR